MIKVFLIVLGISALCAVVFFALWKTTKEKLKRAEHDLNAVVDTNHVLIQQIEKMQKENKIKSDNREKADEKIESLHTGDTVDNAISSLSKH